MMTMLYLKCHKMIEERQKQSILPWKNLCLNQTYFQHITDWKKAQLSDTLRNDHKIITTKGKPW